MFVTNWISTTKIQKISEITNFFRHYFLSRTEVLAIRFPLLGFVRDLHPLEYAHAEHTSIKTLEFHNRKL